MDKAKIPPLPFGQRLAVESLDAEAMSEVLSRNAPSRVAYRPLSPDSPFRSASSFIPLDGVRIVANASSATRFSATDTSMGVLLIPFAGRSVVDCDGVRVEWGGSAAFLPPASSRGENGPRAVMAIDMNPAVLEPLARAMTGRTGSAPLLDFKTPRSLALDVGRVRFRRLFQHYAASLDALDAKAPMITRAGLDEAILRAAIMLLQPDLFFDEPRASPRPDLRIDEACDYIRANLDRRITLSELERITGLSARWLQYAFRATFDQTPSQWIAERRLEVVRARLLAARGDDTVAAIVSPYFVNLGDFAAIYMRRYGEKPSETLRQARRRRT